MYELPENRAAVDAWWAGLARCLRSVGLEAVPDRLVRVEDPESGWHAADLLFSQTCGYPLTHNLKGAVRVIATPCYRAAGCQGAYYGSAIVVRADDPARALADLAGRRAAFNARHSQSGYNVLRHRLAALANGRPILSGTVETGSHAASVAAVAEARADFAAVDCVTLALLQRHRPGALSALRVLSYTARAPGLPFITGGNASDERLGQLRSGLRLALSESELVDARGAMLLTGAMVLPADAYRVIDRMEQEAIALGYPELA